MDGVVEAVVLVGPGPGGGGVAEPEAEPDVEGGSRVEDGRPF